MHIIIESDAPTWRLANHQEVEIKREVETLTSACKTQDYLLTYQHPTAKIQDLEQIAAQSEF